MLIAKRACRIFAVVAGLFLLAAGIWGLRSSVVFSVLTTNHLQATIHIALGAAGLWTAMRAGARYFCLVLGFTLAAGGILWLVPWARPLLHSVLNVNSAVAFVNLIAGMIALLLGFSARRAPARTAA